MPRLEAALARLARWDEDVCAGLNRAAGVRALRLIFRAASRLGDGLLWYGLMLALLAAGGTEAVPAVLHMAAVGAACALAYRLLKTGTRRPRPCEVHAHIAAGAAPLDRFSFPSGHTMHAAAFSIVASAWCPALAPALAVVAALIALSRMVLGLHYPSDVLAGAALGALVAAASLALGR
jgi:undecaprenyl-diphosphatase